MPEYETLEGKAVDVQVKRNLHTFLSAYFNGGSHAIGTWDPVTFAKANIVFDQGAIAQPLQKPNEDPVVEIRILFDAGRPDRFPRDGGFDVIQAASLQFTIRAKVITPAVGVNSKELAQQTADQLHDLLNNPMATLDLAGAGMGQFRPRKQSTKQSADYVTRLVGCGLRLSYQTTF